MSRWKGTVAGVMAKPPKRPVDAGSPTFTWSEKTSQPSSARRGGHSAVAWACQSESARRGGAELAGSEVAGDVRPSQDRHQAELEDGDGGGHTKATAATLAISADKKDTDTVRTREARTVLAGEPAGPPGELGGARVEPGAQSTPPGRRHVAPQTDGPGDQDEQGRELLEGAGWIEPRTAPAVKLVVLLTPSDISDWRLARTPGPSQLAHGRGERRRCFP